MNKDECMELKNLKYQTMLLNQKTEKKETQPNISNIEKFLEKEQENNIMKPWNKLGKGTKLKKVYEYVDNYLKDNPEKKGYEIALKTYLLECLDRKKLQKKKDVIYDMEKNKIKDIPNLYFNEKKKKYSLKRSDKKSSTLKSLPTRKNKSGGKKSRQKKRETKIKTQKIKKKKKDDKKLEKIQSKTIDKKNKKKKKKKKSPDN